MCKLGCRKTLSGIAQILANLFLFTSFMVSFGYNRKLTSKEGTEITKLSDSHSVILFNIL